MRRSLVLIAAAALLPGCAIPVAYDELDWRTPVLSKQGCPDLTGNYRDESEPLSYKCRWCSTPSLRTNWLFLLITGGPKRPFEGVTVGVFEASDNRTSAAPRISGIRQTHGLVEVERIGAKGTVHAKAAIRLAQPNIGCHDDALVVRQVVNLLGAEGGSGSVQYSETAIRKMPDGRLKVTEWHADRYRSRLTGKAYGPVLNAEERSWIFNPTTRDY